MHYKTHILSTMNIPETFYSLKTIDLIFKAFILVTTYKLFDTFIAQLFLSLSQSCISHLKPDLIYLMIVVRIQEKYRCDNNNNNYYYYYNNDDDDNNNDNKTHGCCEEDSLVLKSLQTPSLVDLKILYRVPAPDLFSLTFHNDIFEFITFYSLIFEILLLT